MALFQFIQKVPALFFNHGKHIVKSPLCAVIRVRNIVFAQKKRQITKRRHGFETGQQGMVPGIHRQNIMKPREISLFHFARTQITHIDAPCQRGGNRAFIRRIADVIAVRTGRIDMKTCLKPRLPHLMAKDRLGGGGSAYIARTDEKNAQSFHPGILPRIGPPLYKLFLDHAAGMLRIRGNCRA